LLWPSLALVLLDPTGAAAQAWPQSRGDAQNSGSVVLRAPDSGVPAEWTFEGSGRVWGYTPGVAVWTSAAAATVAGRAIVALGSYDHNLYVLDAASGDLLWKKTTGGSVGAAPTIWEGGGEPVLFVTSNDRLLYALDAETGRRLWIHSVADYRPTLGGARLSSAVVGKVGARDAVFVAHWVWDRSLTQNFQEGGVTALDARTGEPLWRRVIGDNELTAPVYAQTGDRGRLFVGSASGVTLSLEAQDGSVVWQQIELDAVRGAPAVSSTPIGARVITASRSGIVRCLDARTGAEQWRYQTGDWGTAAPVSMVLHARQLVVVGSYDRSVYALDLVSGELVWRYFGRGGFYSGVAAIPSGSRAQVVAAGWDHHLRGIEAREGVGLWERYSGRPLWDTVGLEHSTWSAPTAIEINGRWTVVFGSYDGVVYGLPIADLTAAGMAARRSNLGFWVSFPVVLLLVAGLARGLTRVYRRRRGNG
jgi:outer membrane protein assembly factor BamB